MTHTFLTYQQYLKEGLIKTSDIDTTINRSPIFLNPLKIFYSIKKNSNNTIILSIDHLNKIQDISGVFDCIESYFTNINGWFPSSMVITNLSNMANTLIYNRGYLSDKISYFKSIDITFESKFDIKKDIPKKLYHLTIKHFQNQIQKSGLFPKNKSKLTMHPDRIYLCQNVNDCISLIPQMKMFYKSQKWNNTKNNVDDKWVIYEIGTTNLDVEVFMDPNYKNGLYVLGNIPPNNIKLIDSE